MSFDYETLRAKIVADYPLFSKFMFGLETVEDTQGRTKTIATDGKEIIYNKKFMDSRTPQDQYFMYLHEIGHVFLGHHIRVRPEHDIQTAQKAADYCVNDLLADAGLKLPHDALYSTEFTGMAYEEIYKVLYEKKEKSPRGKSQKWKPSRHGEVQPEQGQGQGEQSDDPQAGKSNNDSQVEERLKQHEQQQAEAIQQGRMAGNMSANLQRYLDNLRETKTNWRELLPCTIEDLQGMDDYTWEEPDERFHDSDFILPGMVGEKRGVVVLMMDTSGSINEKQSIKMASEAMTAIEDTQPEKVYVIWADSAVKNVQEFTDFDSPKLKPKGGGGTDFRPAFKWLEDNNVEPTTVVYMTDGYCTRWPEEPAYPVIWVIWQDNRKIKAPFGEVIVMHDNN